MSAIQAPRSLARLFWVGAALLVAFEVVAIRPESVVLLAVGNGLIALALVPVWLWCTGRVGGLPIFPLLSFTYVPAFGLQLLEPNTNVQTYPEDARVTAAFTVALFLALGTATWSAAARGAARPPGIYLAFRGEQTNGLFLAFVALGCLFQLCTNAAWLPEMPAGMYSILRALCQSTATLGICLLAYRVGRRQVAGVAVAGFVFLNVAYVTLLAASLVTAAAISTTFAAVAMFSLGRGRLPLSVLAIAFVVFSVLHAGKHELRAKYWSRGLVIRPTDYPAYFAEWFESGIRKLTSDSTEEKGASLKDRASVLQILLLVQSQSPEVRPFMNGDTYEIIPELLVPRILLEDKVWSHEGTYRLNIYYGRQTREQTATTTIGFGHLSEAYANFGFFGVAVLAVLTGLTTGVVTRWSGCVPLDSFRGLIGLVSLSLAIQTEHTLGVTLSALSQSVQIIILLSILLMTRTTPPVPAASEGAPP